MVEQLTKAFWRRSTAKRRANDTLSTPEGIAIPVWQSEATDPVAHLAGVFDQLPGRRHASVGKHRND